MLRQVSQQVYASCIAFILRVYSHDEGLLCEITLPVCNWQLDCGKTSCLLLANSLKALCVMHLQNKEEEQEAARFDAVFPCILSILPAAVFNKKDPIVVGVDIVEGIAKVTSVTYRFSTGSILTAVQN